MTKSEFNSIAVEAAEIFWVEPKPLFIQNASEIKTFRNRVRLYGYLKNVRLAQLHNLFNTLQVLSILLNILRKGKSLYYLLRIIQIRIASNKKSRYVIFLLHLQ